MKKKLFMILLCGCVLISLTGCGKEEYYCCDDGKPPKDGECLRAEIMTTDVIYTCPDGYTAKSDGVCYLNGQRRMFAKATYSCPDGGTVSGNQCVKYYSYAPTKCDKPATDNNKGASNQPVEVEVKENTKKEYDSSK